MDEIVATFFDRSFEGPITAEMLEFGYSFPTVELEDYVITVIATPYRKFVDFVHEYVCPKRIDCAAEIPQTSSYDLSTYGVCKMLNAIEDPGVTVLDFGRFLYPSSKRNVKYKDIEDCPEERIKAFANEYGKSVDSDKGTYMCLDGKERNKGAIVKIAENQLKGAEFHGLVYELGGKWFLTCIGRVYSTLDEEMQHALSARTLLRKAFYWKVMGEAVDHDVDIRPYIKAVCNGTTIDRRLSSSQNFFDICIEQCKNDGLNIHRIYSLDFKWPIKEEVSKAAQYKTHLPVYSIRAACGAFNHGDTTELEGWMNVKKLGINPKKDYYLVHAEGNSMEPKIHDGDLCVFAYTNAEEEGEIMLVESNKDDCQHVIKVYHSEKRQVDAFTTINKVKLHSLNPDYDDIELTEEHNPKITGILVDVIKKER